MGNFFTQPPRGDWEQPVLELAASIRAVLEVVLKINSQHGPENQPVDPLLWGNAETGNDKGTGDICQWVADDSIHPIDDYRAGGGQHDVSRMEISMEQFVVLRQAGEVAEKDGFLFFVKSLDGLDFPSQPFGYWLHVVCLAQVHLKVEVSHLAGEGNTGGRIVEYFAHHGLAVHSLVDDPEPPVDLNHLAGQRYPVACLLAGEGLAVLEFGCPSRPAFPVELEDLILTPGVDLGCTSIGEL